MILTILPGPPGPAPDAEPAQPSRPGLGPFLRGRVLSSNGVAAGLYLALSAWILANPDHAARIWRRLQGDKTA